MLFDTKTMHFIHFQGRRNWGGRGGQLAPPIIGPVNSFQRKKEF